MSDFMILYTSFYFAEVVEHACSITTLLQGESMAGISKDMDTHSYRTPLGVCGGVSAYVSLKKYCLQADCHFISQNFEDYLPITEICDLKNSQCF